MNTLTSNQKRRPSRSIWTVSLLLLTCVAFGCKSKLDASEKGIAKAAKEIPQAEKKEVDVLSIRQSAAFEKHLSEKMKTEITKENAKETLEQLQKEIEADIAAGK